MPERAVGNPEQIGGFGLYAVGAVQRTLQQRALDVGYIAFHAYALRKHGTRCYFGRAT
jgi:hypothetical protein